MTSPTEAALVEGVDVDAVAAAVRRCPAVDDLDGGRLGAVGTYLPGRRVPGIRIEDGRIEVHVRSTWNSSASAVATQIRIALRALAGGRPIDIVLSDVAIPGEAAAAAEAVTAAARPIEPAGTVSALAGPGTGAGPAAGANTMAPNAATRDTVETWTTPSASVVPDGNSSGPTIPTAEGIRPSS